MKPISRRLMILTLLAAAAGSDVAEAQPAAPKQVRLGVFAPNSAFTSSSAFRYITGLARHVQTTAGVRTIGRSYRSSAAFRRALPGLHYAVVDPVFLCGRRLTVVASGRLGGGTLARWGLYARSAATLGGLRGKRLALAASGAGDVSFAEGMLAGRIRVKRYFGRVVYRKDLRSAINAVKAGRADAVLAPAVMAKGLRRIFASPKVPNAGLARIKPLPAPLAKKVAAAIRGYGATGVGGWGAAARYRCPSGRVRYPMTLLPHRHVPPAATNMIRKLPPGTGYRLAPLLTHFRLK